MYRKKVTPGLAVLGLSTRSQLYLKDEIARGNPRICSHDSLLSHLRIALAQARPLPANMASRSPSPTRLKLTTVTISARLGYRISQGAFCSIPCPSLIMLPQLGVGGCTPTPR